MSFGFLPKHVRTLPLGDLTPEHFLVIALGAAEKLNWDVGYISETGFIAHTKFSMSSWSEEIKVKLDEGSCELSSECTGSQLVDWGKNKKNIERFVATFNELKEALTAAELAQKFEALKPELVSKEGDLLRQPPPTTKENITSFLAIFIPTKGFFITPILINLNLIVFILMAISGVNIFFPDNESLIMWGANFQPVTLDGEWWRLLTSCFVHIGILHLLMNLYAMLYIGLLLEPRIGTTRFATSYVLTGIVASTTSLWWNDWTISAGASGAIFGMYGLFLAMLTTNLIEKGTRKALLTSIGIFVAYNLMNGMQGGIDNAAHIGGLICGLFMGYAFYPSLKKHDSAEVKFATLGILTALLLTTSILVIQKIPNQITEYDAKMERFFTMEAMALEVYKMPPDAPAEDLLFELKDRGLYYWNENIKLLKELDQLNLPDHIHDQNRALIEYCNLRIQSYNLIYQAIEQDTDAFQDSIDYYHQRIEAAINEFQE